MSESSLVFKAYDQVSSTMKDIASGGKSLSKEYEALERRAKALAEGNETLRKRLGTMTKDLTAAKKEMQEAQKQFKKTGEEADGLRLEKAVQEYERLSAAIKETRSASDITMKSMKNNADQMRKLFDSTGSGGSGGIGSLFSSEKLSSLAGGLAQAGLIKELGTSLSGALGAGITSYLGQPSATLVSSLTSGAVSGAAAGAMLGPWGALAGAGIGAVSGLISGSTKIFEQKDDAFKSYVQEAFENQLTGQEASLTSGSTTAGSREQTLMAFSQRFGSDAAASAFLEEVKEMARSTNYGFDEITGYSKLLLNSYNEKEVFGVLQSLSDATAGLSLNSSDVSMMIAGLSRMRTTGKATQEYLNYFTERGVDTYQALANATGADKTKIAEMVTGGEISGETAAQAILDYINQTYGGLSDKLATTYDAMVDNLTDFQTDMDAAMGEGYNEGRKAGLQAQMDWMSGESGKAVEEANRAIGAWQAELENQKEKYIRDAMDAMMGSDEYQAAKEADNAAEMGRLLMEAKIQGMNEYNASEGAQLALESEKALAEAIRNDTATNEDYWDAGYEKGNWFTKGLAAAIAETYEPTYYGGIMGYDAMINDPYILNAWNSNAYGLSYVPYDNFPALLHEGEKVLTAAEARSGSKPGANINVSVTGNNFSVRSDDDADMIAAMIVTRIEEAMLSYGG